jgi:hypothetical protein
MLTTSIYTMPLHFHYPTPQQRPKLTLRHDKGQANGKLSKLKSIFIKLQMSNGLHCHKKVVMQKRVFSVGSFFDTFLAVQKSMPNAYDIAINHSLPSQQQRPMQTKKLLLSTHDN